MDEKKVFDVIRKWEKLDHGKKREPGVELKSYQEAATDFAYLVGAWRWFKDGKATPEQQKVCYFIHNYLIKYGEKYKQNPVHVRYSRIHNLVQKHGFTQKKACQMVADMDGICMNEDTWLKGYRDWKQQSPEKIAADTAKFLKSYKNPFI